MPPFETIFLRSIFATAWVIGFMALTGGLGDVRKVAVPRVAWRNGIELIAVLGFIIGLSNVPIAEFTALNQLAPILLMLVAGLFLGLKVTRIQLAFAAIAFVGAILVAQPGGASFSWFYLFGLWNAGCAAARELVGRSVPKGIPGVVVALGAALFAFIGAGIAMLVFEDFQVPDLRQLVLLGSAAFFLVVGHTFIFMAYRTADPGAVSPFVYTSALWAVIASVVVFGYVPNMLALSGMVLIVISGIGVLVVSERYNKRAAARAAAP